MKPQLISIILPDLRGGGVERIRLVLAKEFALYGHEVEFVLLQARGELLEEARASYLIHDLNVPRVRKVLPRLVSYLRERKPDALMAAMWPLTVIAPLAVHLSGHRCGSLISEHNNLVVQYQDRGGRHLAAMRASMAIAYRLADRRVGVSEGVADSIAKLSGLRRDAFDVIHNPVVPRPEPSAETLAAAEALWAVPRGARIVTVGSMKVQKNHPLLLNAFARLDRPDARLMIVGDGEERTALLALAQDLGIADRVILAGFHHDPTPFYKTADLFVLSSDYEGFGNVVVEALACGIPVVSTDCPSGPAEILEGGRYGRLVPIRDARSLAQAVEEALAAPVDRELLKRRAADFAPAIAAGEYLRLMKIRG